MTFQQMSDTLTLRIDQAGSPSFIPTEIDTYLNWAYNSWYEQTRPNFNKVQAFTDRLTHLIEPFSFTGVNQITLYTTTETTPAMINDYRDLARMKGVWNQKDCNGNIAPKERNIVPVPLSSVDTNTQDPNNIPTDRFPMYKKGNNGTYRVINILSTSTPLSISGDYFRLLQVINSATNPNGVFEAADYIANEIIEIAKILMKTDVDDFEQATVTAQESKGGV